MKILYGLPQHQLDITKKVLSHFVRQNIAVIPKGDDDRAYLFTDPLPRVLKVITIIVDGVETIIDHTHQAYIDLTTHKVYMNDIPSYIQDIYPYDLNDASHATIEKKLKDVHKTLKLVHGSMTQEFPEQGMAMRFLTGNEKVLEIGANVGRNSLMIQSILSKKGNTNFVTLESDAGIASQLQENRDANHMYFHIEASALSKRKLIQRGWDTIVSDEVLPGYHSIQTITLEELRNKYKIAFDTLVLDCEGAFYYILMDMPDIMDDINLVIMENDYYKEEHKKFIDDTLTQKGLKRVYVQNGGWECRYYNKFPDTYMNFFEVWQK
jgi:FkbM family methyltransferase